jgi:hypothetical protein
MNQPLDFVTHDLDLMMPGSQPMLTGGPGMFSSMVPPSNMPFGSQPGPNNGFNSGYGRPF